MAGGTWIAQNKIRPGAYINFKAVPQNQTNLGNRGVVTFPVAMTWADNDDIIEILSTDLLDGVITSKIGISLDDEACQIYRQALMNCSKALVYRLDTGGEKAKKTFENITVTAKYAGTAGNDISIAIVENSNNSDNLDIITYYRNAQKDTQTVAKATASADVKDNDWVTFTGSGAVNPVVITKLEGGTNGSIQAENYTKYFKLIQAYEWNTMAIPQASSVATSSVKEATVNLIRDLRENQGIKAQAVLLDSNVNYEGIISVKQGYKTLDEDVSPETFTAYIAGLTAGSAVNQSNTYKVIDNAVDIIYPNSVEPYTNADIENALKSGQLILTKRRDGAIVIEQDINTLHSPYPSNDVNYNFTKNRVIRVLDEINNNISLTFHSAYIGKVNNDERGRSVFKADVISYLNKLQSIGAIQNFNPSTDLTVVQGEKIDSVIVTLNVQPIDSIEKLYMTVNVG